MQIRFALVLITGLFALTTAQAVPVTFEDVPLGNPGVDGSEEYNSSGTYYWNGSDESGSFSSGGATFINNYNSAWSSWTGFAASNTTDTTTNSYTNQYSAITGSGASGSGTYGIGYGSPTLTFDTAFDFSGGKGMWLTNNTYAALDMANGSGFSKKFGGDSGTDEDWFKVTIAGSNGGSSTGSVEFYLADFRSADSGEDYILYDWAFADLSSLGTVDQLDFSLSSSDNGTYGMNTPSYFAVDNIGMIPEASTLASLLVGGIALLHFLRRKQA